MKFIIIPYTITPFVCGSIGYLYGYMHNIHKHQGLGNIRHTSKEFTILYGIIGTIKNLCLDKDTQKWLDELQIGVSDV